MENSTGLEVFHDDIFDWKKTFRSQKNPHLVSLDMIAQKVKGFAHVPGRSEGDDVRLTEQWKNATRAKRLHKWTVESLQFNLINISKNKIASITEDIAKGFPEVKELKIHVSASGDNQSIYNFSKVLSSRFTNIKSFSLEICLCTKVEDQILEFLVKDIGVAMKKLKHFNFSFQLTSPYYKLFAIKPSIQDGLRITPEGLKKAVCKLALVNPGLLSLGFRLTNQRDFNDEQLQYLGKIVTWRLPQLQRLSIGLHKDYDPNVKLTDKGLSEFSQLICKGLPELRHLGLHVPRCHFIRGPGIMTFLGLAKEQLKNLTSLSLDFNQCDETPSDTIEKIGQLVSQLESLTKLSLNLSNIGSIKEETVKSITTQITTNLGNLTHFDLNFNRCWRVTAENLLFMAESTVKNLKKLRYLALRTARIQNVSPYYLEKVVEIFQSASLKLSVLVLDVFRDDVRKIEREQYRTNFLPFADTVEVPCEDLWR